MGWHLSRLAPEDQHGGAIPTLAMTPAVVGAPVFANRGGHGGACRPLAGRDQEMTGVGAYCRISCGANARARRAWRKRRSSWLKGLVPGLGRHDVSMRDKDRVPANLLELATMRILIRQVGFN